VVEQVHAEECPGSCSRPFGRVLGWRSCAVGRFHALREHVRPVHHRALHPDWKGRGTLLLLQGAERLLRRAAVVPGSQQSQRRYSTPVALLPGEELRGLHKRPAMGMVPGQALHSRQNRSDQGELRLRDGEGPGALRDRWGYGRAPTCTTGIISSATVKGITEITDFLKTTSELKPFPIKVLKPAEPQQRSEIPRNELRPE
jgi:hypothetical protein